MSASTIALVEDEETVAGAADGPGGVELCGRVAPDLVILDLLLPGFAGLEVCRRIQAERTGR